MARQTKDSLKAPYRQSILATFQLSLTEQELQMIIEKHQAIRSSQQIKHFHIQDAKSFLFEQLQLLMFKLECFFCYFVGAVQYFFEYILQFQKMSNQFHYLLKYIVVGDTGVGKSCVVLQFIEQKINQNHQITIGVEFASRTIQIDSKSGSKNIKFQVWDTAGQQNFRSITRSYYRSAIGALLIYDITKRKTFEHLQEWLKQIKSNGSNQLEILVIGNKTDLESEREISSEEGRKFAESNNLQWVELSAKNYSNVQSAFIKLANKIITRIQSGQITQTTPGIKICNDMRINPLKDSTKSCC